MINLAQLVSPSVTLPTELVLLVCIPGIQCAGVRFVTDGHSPGQAQGPQGEERGQGQHLQGGHHHRWH